MSIIHPYGELYPETGLLVRQAVEQGKFPRFLHRYRSFDDYTEATFQKYTQYFSHPLAFNDPFDCQIRDLGGYTSDDILAYFAKAGISGADASPVAIQNAKDSKWIGRLLEEAKEKSFRDRGIMCVTSKNDDILMWSHYANSHAGFVLTFDVLKDPDFFAPLFRVIYSDDYPAFQYLKDPSKIISHGAATKSKHWEYENEYRVIKNEVGPKQFDKAALVEVIVGARVRPKNTAGIATYLGKYGYGHTKLRQARISSLSYRMEISDTVDSLAG